MGKYMQNPLVWLRRFRKRCGYGVHSPYAFSFITDVVYERSAYYAYKELDDLFPLWVSRLGLRPRKLARLLFRVANFAHPRRACVLGGSEAERAHIQAAVPTAQWEEKLQNGVLFDFLFLDEAVPDSLSHVGPDSVLVLSRLRDNLDYWKTLLADDRVVLSFDLYDVGILMFNKRFNRMDYVVNF